MKELRYLNKYFIKYKWRMLLGFVITVLARIFAVYVPRFVGNASDLIAQYLDGEFTDKADYHSQLINMALLIFAVALIAGFFTFLMRQTFIVVSRNIEYDLKNEVYSQYQNLSLNFYKKNRTGDLMNRISEDVSKVRLYFGPALMNTVSTFTMFVVVIIYMLDRAPILTLYTVAPFPILSYLIYRISQAIHRRSTVVQQYLSHLSSFTQESFSGISVIKSYGIQPQTNEDFSTLANASKDKQIDLAKVQAFLIPMIALLIGGSNVLVIFIGGRQLINGQIESVGTIVEFLLYVNMLTWPVTSVGWITTLIQQAEASQKRINEFLDVSPEIFNKTQERHDIIGEIEFKNVTFTYDDTNITALKNVSFTINPGETLAILGKTGSGKSTILELIGRLYDIDEGELLIDNIPIDQINLNDLRSSLGYVPQDSFLFSESIKNNIKFGNPEADENEVLQAAKNASIHQNIIGFHKGYDTILGERGLTLSGGQKQRISLARALIQDPKIFLFDDSLSAVDTETEEKILNNLKRISKDKTTIIVSHRISTIKNADKIIIMDEGEIVEQGNHESLIKNGSYYQELYEKQLSEKDN
ncbi:MAG TPA: ABC transporter ATP-binding protein [Flavobacteriaceae bacterium]|nr:ABC transporter ATP-binding protein [Flavobacteriaceae bacterium]